MGCLMGVLYWMGLFYGYMGIMATQILQLLKGSHYIAMLSA